MRCQSVAILQNVKSTDMRHARLLLQDALAVEYLAAIDDDAGVPADSLVSSDSYRILGSLTRSRRSACRATACS